MTLADYLKENCLTHAGFAARIGATQAAVTRYANGKRKPNLTKIVLIEQATEGAVKASDFVPEVVDGGAPTDAPHPQPQGATL